MITEKRKQMHKEGPIVATPKDGSLQKKDIQQKPSADQSQAKDRQKTDIDAERHPEEQVVDPKVFPEENEKVFRPIDSRINLN